MRYDANNLRKADDFQPDPSQTVTVEMKQEWFRNLLLCSVLFLILCLMAVFMSLGIFDGVFKDNPDTRHIAPEGPAYVMIENINDAELN